MQAHMTSANGYDTQKKEKRTPIIDSSRSRPPSLRLGESYPRRSRPVIIAAVIVIAVISISHTQCSFAPSPRRRCLVLVVITVITVIIPLGRENGQTPSLLDSRLSLLGRRLWLMVARKGSSHRRHGLVVRVVLIGACVVSGNCRDALGTLLGGDRHDLLRCVGAPKHLLSRPGIKLLDLADEVLLVQAPADATNGKPDALVILLINFVLL